MAKSETKYMTDRSGDAIPTRLVTSYDRKRDQIVRRIVKRYQAAQVALESVKNDTAKDLASLEALALAEAGVRDFKSKGGNVTISSYDGLLQVQCKNRVFSGLDERAKIAKQMLEEFVAELTEGQEKDDIVQIVNSLLDTRSGEINRTAALRVMKLNLKSEKFRQAKEILQDSMFASMSKTYIYVETRESRESDPVQIMLDIAKLTATKEVKSAGPADAQAAQ